MIKVRPTSSSEPKVVFLQHDFEKYPRGLALIEVGKPSLYLQAEAMVGENVEPCGFYVPYGVDRGDVIRIPRFSEWVRSYHPDAKEVMGPFVSGEITITKDRLPEKFFAIVTFTKTWPKLNAVICYNDLKPKHGQVVYDRMPLCYGGEDMKVEILNKIQESRME